jgi:hypothetical protein
VLISNGVLKRGPTVNTSQSRICVVIEERANYCQLVLGSGEHEGCVFLGARFAVEGRAMLDQENGHILLPFHDGMVERRPPMHAVRIDVSASGKKTLHFRKISFRGCIREKFVEARCGSR